MWKALKQTPVPFRDYAVNSVMAQIGCVALVILFELVAVAKVAFGSWTWHSLLTAPCWALGISVILFLAEWCVSIIAICRLNEKWVRSVGDLLESEELRAVRDCGPGERDGWAFADGYQGWLGGMYFRFFVQPGADRTNGFRFTMRASALDENFGEDFAAIRQRSIPAGSNHALARLHRRLQTHAASGQFREWAPKDSIPLIPKEI